jgi:1-aminocyclopropane-1-carboxylate deaminase/D-cysteine desulfhydrase-like pyridoxal-dependent ACC family enzyme
MTELPTPHIRATSGPRRPWDKLPRRRIAPLPTPLDPLPRFGAAIGAEVWAKRDDIGSLTLAGNKARKLEYLVADALANGCDTLVATGAVQSNFARAAAAAAAAAGLRAVLVLRPSPAGMSGGNELLDRAVGAEIRIVDAHSPAARRAFDETIAELRATGARPYPLPVGGSTPIGDAGYAAAWDELLGQLDDARISPDLLVVTTGSGGTQAGLELGRHVAGRGPRIQGVAVVKVEPDVPALVARLATEGAAYFGVAARWEPTDVAVDMDFLGQAYGVPTPQATEAIDLLARTEGILCDPVYSGKALAALVAYVRRARVRGPVVFWHTGGAQVLFSDAFAPPR